MNDEFFDNTDYDLNSLIDQKSIEKIYIENSICELEDFSYHLLNQFNQYIHSTGSPIGQYLTSSKIFEFNIFILNKFEK